MAVKVTLQQFFQYCWDGNLSFAFYRLPEDKIVKVVAQQKEFERKKSSAHKLIGLKGFLFAPFQEDRNFSRVFIHSDIFCDENTLPELNFSLTSNGGLHVQSNESRKLKETTKTEFIKYIGKIQTKIQDNHFKKVVAARVIKKGRTSNFNPVKYFQLLCKEHPDALVSLVFTKQYGLWIGASPEILFSAGRKQFKTYSLAGTKENSKYSNGNGWGKKEKEEQKIVSDYILKTFGAITKVKPFVRGPETITAGNLLHLRTTFTFKSAVFSKWEKIVEQLHPTPAVAGIPKERAIEFILQNEKTPRSFYGGFLGPVNLEGKVNLFVNIRCMNVLEKELIIHVGCGITADSKPSKEWKETRIKSETLLRLLARRKPR